MVVDESGRGGGERRVRDDPDAGHGAHRPDDPERGDGPDRRRGVPVHDPRQAEDRQRQEDDQGHAQCAGSHQGDHRSGPTDRVDEEVDGGSDVGPVDHGVERPPQRRQEAHVQDLDDAQQTEGQADRRRRDALRAGRQDQHEQDDEEPLEGDPDERARAEPSDLGRCEQGEPHEQAGQHRGDRGGDGVEPGSPPRATSVPRWVRAPGESAHASRTATGSASRPGTPLRPTRGAGTASRPGSARRCPQSHHTSRPNDSVSRASAATRARFVARREGVRRREGQHHPLRRRDDLAPVARRQ